MPRALFCTFAFFRAENGLFRIEFFQAAFLFFQLRCSKIEKSAHLTAPRNRKKWTLDWLHTHRTWRCGVCICIPGPDGPGIHTHRYWSWRTSTCMTSPWSWRTRDWSFKLISECTTSTWRCWWYGYNSTGPDGPVLLCIYTVSFFFEVLVYTYKVLTDLIVYAYVSTGPNGPVLTWLYHYWAWRPNNGMGIYLLVLTDQQVYGHVGPGGPTCFSISYVRSNVWKI